MVVSFMTDEEETNQNGDTEVAAEKELKDAHERLRDAESCLSDLQDMVEILKAKKAHSQSFIKTSEEHLKNKKYSDASIYAKEGIKQADEIISDIRGYDYRTWLALGLEIFFIILAFVGIYYLFNLPNWSKEVNALGIPFWAFLAGFLGAVAYAAHGVAYHYYKGDFGWDDVFFYIKGFAQGTLLAAPVYLILNNLTGTQQLTLDMTNFTSGMVNATTATPENITGITARMTSSQPNIQVLGAACFLTGLFTRHAIEFLYFVANRLFKLPERGEKQ